MIKLAFPLLKRTLLTSLSSAGATSGQVPVADGSGGISWQTGGGGSSSLQDAYDNGKTIVVADGFPIAISSAVGASATTPLLTISNSNGAFDQPLLQINNQTNGEFGLEINSTGSAGAIKITSSNVGGAKFYMPITVSHTGSGNNSYFVIDGSATGGSGTLMYVRTNYGVSASNPAVFFHSDSATNDQSVLTVRQDGTGNIVEFQDSGAFPRVYVDKDGVMNVNTGVTNGAAFQIDPASKGSHLWMTGVLTDPDGAGLVEGRFWYNEATDLLKLRTTATTETIAFLSNIPATSLQAAYNGGNTISNNQNALSTLDFSNTNAGASAGTAFRLFSDTGYLVSIVGGSGQAPYVAGAGGVISNNNLLLGSILGDINFFTGTGTPTSADQKMVIKLNGDVGIGTLTPNSLFQVQDFISFDPILFNTFLGEDAGNIASNTGTNATAIGYQAMFKQTAGADNTAIGSQALWNHLTGQNNTAVGYQALYGDASGLYNTGVGFQAGFLNNIGTGNTFLGWGADVTVDGLTNTTALGYNAKVTTSNSLVLGGTGADSVNVGFGTASPATKLDIFDDAGIQLLQIGDANSSFVGFPIRGITGYDIAASNSFVIGEAEVAPATYLGVFFVHQTAGEIGTLMGIGDTAGNNIGQFSSFDGISLGDDVTDTATGRFIQVYAGDGAGGRRWWVDGADGLMQLGVTAGDPALTADGQIGYNSTSDRFRVQANGVTESIAYLSDTAGSATLQVSYNNGATITTAAATPVTITVPNTSNNTALVINQNDVTNNPNGIEINNTGTGFDIRGTASTWAITKAGDAGFFGTQWTFGNATNAGANGLTILASNVGGAPELILTNNDLSTILAVLPSNDGGAPNTTFLIGGDGTAGGGAAGDLVISSQAGKIAFESGTFGGFTLHGLIETSGTWKFGVETSSHSLTGNGDVIAANTEVNGTLFMDDSLAVHRTAVGAGGYTVTANDLYIAITTITGGGDTIAIPDASTAGIGKTIVIKDASGTAGTNNLTLDPAGSDTIDGAATYLINTNGDSVVLISDGISNWEVN